MSSVAAQEYEVVVVGAGIAGLATALALHKANVHGVVLLDKYNDIKSEGAAVMMFPNGWHALHALGLSEKFEDLYPPCHRENRTNLKTGETKEFLLTGTDDSPGIGVRTLHRRTLLKILAEELPLEKIRFSSKLVKIESESTSLESSSNFTTLRLEDGTAIKTKVLIGCDGAHSLVAQWLGLAEPVDSKRSVVRGLAEYEHHHGFGHEMQEYIFGDRRGGFVPLNDKELYWFITHDTAPGDLEKTMHPKLILRQVNIRLAKNFPDSFLEVVQHADPDTVTWTHMLYRPPWDILLDGSLRGHVTVTGDAYHPIAPDLSFGSCLTLEDAVVLARHLGNCVQNKDVKDALGAYVRERRWRLAGLATGSYLSCWIDSGGSDSGLFTRVIKSLGERLFERFVRWRITEAMNYDCGGLNN